MLEYCYTIDILHLYFADPCLSSHIPSSVLLFCTYHPVFGKVPIAGFLRYGRFILRKRSTYLAWNSLPIDFKLNSYFPLF